jgi:Reverse transcriptase (RNA-dependent DNA polymerase)
LTRPACGCSKVPGDDFQEPAPWKIPDPVSQKFVVIVIAFLHGDVKETIYMEISKGRKAKENKCLISNKTIYGLVQSAKKIHKKLVSPLKECVFNGCFVVPFLWIKYSNHGIALNAINVDL